MGQNLRPFIRMPADSLRDYVSAQRVVILCSLNADGSVHAAPMWYVVVEDRICVTTPRKSQKAANLLRDARLTWLIESGETYDELRGAQGRVTAEIVDDQDSLLSIASMTDHKYRGALPSPERAAELQAQMRKRIGIAVPLDGTVASWDHSRLADLAAGGRPTSSAVG